VPLGVLAWPSFGFRVGNEGVLLSLSARLVEVVTALRFRPWQGSRAVGLP
jgi:hypothetical protein